MRLLKLARDSFRQGLREAYFAHPLTKQIQAAAWDEGHKEGFWNGRASSGPTRLDTPVGIEHAKANNPYRKVA